MNRLIVAAFFGFYSRSVIYIVSFIHLAILVLLDLENSLEILDVVVLEPFDSTSRSLEAFLDGKIDA
jgi:hypothetical protein